MSALFLMKTLGYLLPPQLLKLSDAIYPTYGSKRAIPFGCSFQAISLALFAYLLTLHPAERARLRSLRWYLRVNRHSWLRIVDKSPLSNFDLIGTTFVQPVWGFLCMAGVSYKAIQLKNSTQKFYTD